MRSLSKISLALALALAASTSLASAGNMSHAHMGHVSTAWKDTPNGAGFLPTAQAEAEIAIFHAGLAAKKSDDLGWMKTHTLHVVNAVDPSVAPKGPGMGYGVRKALEGAIKHVGLAAKSGDASGNVKTHAKHVETSASNALVRARKIVRLSKSVAAATTAPEAAAVVKEIAELANQLMAGRDANGDGQITWHKNEGGIAASRKHMGIMAKLEGVMLN